MESFVDDDMGYLRWRVAHPEGFVMNADTVRDKALAAGAARWLDDLPSLVAGLERDWPITVGHAYDDATEAFVAEAIVDGGAPAVLKLLAPRGGAAASNEITLLRLTGGVGCVRLLRHEGRVRHGHRYARGSRGALAG